MKSDKNIILFTGQSGLKVQDCLERLTGSLEYEVNILSIEKTMMKIENEEDFTKILMKNLQSQYKLWKQAFVIIKDEIVKDKSDKTVFLTFHSTFYHPNKREFVSVIDFDELSSIKDKVKSLIVFIDDIYDIYLRLMDIDQMFGNIHKSNPLEAIFESVFNLSTIMEWRQFEIAISRIISRILDINMYIVATKHPIFMVNKLICKEVEELEIYYLSHPISAIRKAGEVEYQRMPAELSAFVEEIKEFENLILFIPGTIDEYRIKKDDKFFIPDFYQRWLLPFEPEDLISPPMPEHLEKNPLNPKGFDFAHSEEIQSAISYLLNLLRDQILRDINSRDLSLVEQSKNGVITYRPFYPNKLSGGVRRELEYNYELYSDRPSRRAIIFSVLKDEYRSRINKLFNLINKKGYIENLDDESKESLSKMCKDWMKNKEKLEIFSSENSLYAEIQNNRKEIESTLPKDYEFNENLFDDSSSLKETHLGKQERRRSKGFEILTKEILKDPYEDFIINIEDIKKFELSKDIKLSKIFKKVKI